MTVFACRREGFFNATRALKGARFPAASPPHQPPE
jgi:hypothetical protein